MQQYIARCQGGRFAALVVVEQALTDQSGIVRRAAVEALGTLDKVEVSALALAQHTDSMPLANAPAMMHLSLIHI